MDFFRSFVLKFYVRFKKRKTPLKTDQKRSKCTQWNSEFFCWKKSKLHHQLVLKNEKREKFWHFLKWQIVKSKYSHNLAENKIAPIASRETYNVICTKRALVIMCSCNRLVIYLCAVWWHTCVQLWHIYSVCMSVWSNTFYSLLWWHKERAQGHVDHFPFFLLSLTSTFSLYTNNHY